MKMKVIKKVDGNTTKIIGKIGKEKTDKVKKPKQKKKKRLIIRNLSFKVNEEELKETFSKFGTLTDVKIPLKPDGKKRGFGFVEFEDAKSLIKAMKSMNYKEIHGRKVAVDFAVDKTTYELKVQDLRKEGNEFPEKRDTKLESEINQVSDLEEDENENDDEDEEESEDEDEKRLNDFLKDFDSGAEALTKIHNRDDSEKVSSDESSSNESEEDEQEEDEDNEGENEKFSSPMKKEKMRDSQDVSEGKTIFLRNVSYTSSQESLREAMEEYGECVYCLLCMDQFTDHPKGTAFVKFQEKSSADKLVQESYSESGVVVDGRKLTCSYAISREDVSHIGEDSKKPKDKRNLNLLRVGLIMPNSPESEGVTSSDMAKRSQLEMAKKQKLRNVNFFVSDKRLMIHNLPRTYNDLDLRKLFKKAAGKGSVITEARVMKEFKKIDAQGTPLSKGFGFVSFTKHEDALKALTELNNNPRIFTSQKRPIVEFSVENVVALLSKERRKEKTKLRNKRRTEEKNERLCQIANDKEKEAESPTKGKKRRKKKKNSKPTENKKRKESPKENQEIVAEENIPKTKQKKKRRKPSRSKIENGTADVRSQQESMSNLITKFKNKINKIT